MLIRSSLTVLLAGLAAQQASAQAGQPNIQIVAQAYDRCMATYAVRLTRTEASDEDIYAQAKESCAPLEQKLKDGITAQFPAADAAEAIEAIDAQAEPNFMAMLAKIRSDRASRAGG